MAGLKSLYEVPEKLMHEALRVKLSFHRNSMMLLTGHRSSDEERSRQGAEPVQREAPEIVNRKAITLISRSPSTRDGAL